MPCSGNKAKGKKETPKGGKDGCGKTKKKGK